MTSGMCICVYSIQVLQNAKVVIGKTKYLVLFVPRSSVSLMKEVVYQGNYSTKYFEYIIIHL